MPEDPLILLCTDHTSENPDKGGTTLKEVKNPKKPLAYYYAVSLAVLLLFNIFVAPLLNRQRVVETDYSTFMRMIE